MVFRFASLFFFILQVHANTVVEFPIQRSRIKRCEDLLQTGSLSMRRRTAIEKAFVAPLVDRSAAIAENIKAPALRVFGLESALPIGARERLIAWMIQSGKRASLRFSIGRADDLFTYDPNSSYLFVNDLSQSPIYEWKNMYAPRARSNQFGLILAGAETVGARAFLRAEFDEREKFIHYTVGVDVNCSRVREFTSGSGVEQISTASGPMCRIPVLFFHRDESQNWGISI